MLVLVVSFTAFVWILFLSSRSISTILKFIFWITFVNMFITHALIQRHIFDITNLGYATRILWVADILTYIVLFKMIMIRKYAKRIIRINLLTYTLLLIVISNALNFESLIYSFLSTRMLYQYLLLAYLLYEYRFSDKDYQYFQTVFFAIAIANSTLSILQFTFMDILNLSPQMTGGVFGYHGTGVGAAFSVLQSGMMFQKYLGSKKYNTLLLSIFFAAPIITGFAYGGFILLAVMLAVTILSFSEGTNMLRMIIKSLASLFVIISTILIAEQIQPEDDFKSYYNKFSNLSNFTDYTIRYTNDNDVTYGRIGTLIFTYNRLIENPATLLFGHGPGSLSYIGYTMGIENKTFAKYGINKIASLFPSYMFETGIVGIVILCYTFISLLRKWRIVKKHNYSEYYEVLNFTPGLLAVYFVGLFYTGVFSNYLLVFYFSINMSKINSLSNKI
jgi:hypothetical protein